MKITSIVAVDQENGIGQNGSMPWHHPEDLKWFKYNTVNHVCMIGRTTYENVGKLPNRVFWVVTHQQREPICDPNGNVIVDFQHLEEYKGRITSGSFTNQYGPTSNLYVCGGGSIYQQMMPMTDECVVTRINESHGCDTFFPDLHENGFKKDAEFELKSDVLTVERWNSASLV